MSVAEPHKIVILGGGTAGWMAANLMAKRWANKPIEITLVESPSVGIIGVGEGSTPTLKRFFESIEITEQEWMPRCDATYKVNIRFSGWSPESGIADYSHPFTCQTDTFSHRAFEVNCRTRRLGLNTHTRPDDFLLNGVLANQNKGPVTPENFPFVMEYGYHFNSQLLGEFLAEIALQRGVQHQQADVVSVSKHNNGDIAALVTKEGMEIKGDFFIDCSGFRSVLLKGALGVPFESFKSNLFNDSAVVLPTPIQQDIPSETLSTAMSAGWCWRIPLTSRFGNGYVYSSDFISSEQAEVELRQHLGMQDSDQECRHLKMKVGQAKYHWMNNCLGIGLAQGFIEPLEATALHLVQISIEMFMAKYDESQLTGKHRDSFNQDIHDRFERVRDYIVAHYKMNTRHDSEYWRVNRENNHLSDSLCHILDVWFKCEDLGVEIERQNLNSHFDSISWHCLLAGYGKFPPLAPNQPGTGDLYQDQGVDEFLRRCSLNFQQHSENLNNLR